MRRAPRAAHASTTVTCMHELQDRHVAFMEKAHCSAPGFHVMRPSMMGTLVCGSTVNPKTMRKHVFLVTRMDVPVESWRQYGGCEGLSR